MPEADVLLELKIKQRNLEEMDGEAHLRAIEGGTWGLSILALIPGMKKGDDPDIIKGVADLIRAIPNDRLRVEIAACTVVIAEAAKRRELWSSALGGINVSDSQLAKEWTADARKAGIKEGRTEGLREGLLNAIELGLELKFGNDGLQLMPQVARLTDLSRLRTIKDSIKSASSVEDIRRFTS